MVWNVLKRAIGGATREVSAEYGQNKDFLEAVCAAASLVAWADGDLEQSEKTKVVSLIQSHPTLGTLYKADQIEQCAQTMFTRGKDKSGRQLLARELDDIKGKPNGSQMAEDVYLLATDIAMADGEMEPQEEETLKKLAQRMGVDASKFEF
jgi:tellurite resistance protein TerB